MWLESWVKSKKEGGINADEYSFCPVLSQTHTSFILYSLLYLAVSQHLTLQNPQRRQISPFSSLGKDTIDSLSLVINRLNMLKYAVTPLLKSVG